MTRSQLISRVAMSYPHLRMQEVEDIVSAVFDSMTHALANGRRVELRGFGSFGVKYREARQGRNPKTGDHVMVVQKYVPSFKVGSVVHNRLNP